MEREREATVVGGASSGYQLKALRSSKSKVWKFFGFAVDEKGDIADKTKVVCRLCERRVAYSGNTTNLFYHLQTSHPREHNEVSTKQVGDSLQKEKRESARQRTISGCFSAQQAYGQHSERYKRCQNALVEFICKDLQPISIVDSPTFLRLLGTLDPRYIPPSRTTFTRTIIPDKYASVKDIVVGSLSASNHCSLTTDLWTGCHKRAYMSATVHYITSEWEMMHHCLQTREVEERHTAENLAEELQAVLKEWGLESKTFGCTTDNASNITNAVKDHLSLIHLPCIGHTLQLSIDRGFLVPSIARVLGRCKMLTQHFNKSTQLTYSLREKQRLLSGGQCLELIQSCPTRWGSTFLMLERIQALQQPLCVVLLDQPREVRYLLPDSEEWTIIEELIAVLKPFHRATTAMSASSYPTLSMLSPLLYKLRNIVLKVKEDDTPSGKALKDAILTDLCRRYASLNQQEVLHIAAFLDPRFKDLDPFVLESERKDVQEAVKLEMLDLDREGDETRPELDTTVQSFESESQDGPSPPKKAKPGSVSYFFSDLSESRAARKHARGSDRVKSEMDRYIQEPLLDLDDDPLAWWQSRQLQYPLMSQLVKKYWSLPATSVRSEEAFSTAGNVLTKKRNRLLPENVDKLVFLHDNM